MCILRLSICTGALTQRRSRYPTFVDAVRDIDDALCMIFLFVSLPVDSKVSPTLTENCARLAAEWQLYVMHTHALRKVFLSIKGVYYQAEVFDQTITWLVPYQFTQIVRCVMFLDLKTNAERVLLQIPPDVDVRVMLTFLELYQTMLGFVFFKLYTDAGLVYPPHLDTAKDDGAAGVGAFSLQEAKDARPATTAKPKVVDVDGKRVSSNDVRQTIKTIIAGTSDGADVKMPAVDSPTNEEDEEFVEDTAEEAAEDTPSAPAFTTATLPTLKTLSTLPQSTSKKLFAPYTFWISRETSRPIFEFIVRAFGGRIGWPATSGTGSPLDEADEAITHVIIDRPLVQRANESEEVQERWRRRKHVQPQWVVDCVNVGRILLEDLYAQGKTLPPHLSPFGEHKDAYDPTVEITGAEEDEGMEDEEIIKGEGEEEYEDEEEEDARSAKAALKAAAAAEDAAALHAAELVAEAAGIDFGTFEKETKKAQKKAKQAEVPKADEAEQNMNKVMMSNKQRKLYERMKYGEKRRATEVSVFNRCCHECKVSHMFVRSDKGWNRRSEQLKMRRNADPKHHNVLVSGPISVSCRYIFMLSSRAYCSTSIVHCFIPYITYILTHT